MASILENLVSDLSSFTAERIQENITAELSAAQKQAKLNADELARYESVLRNKYKTQELKQEKEKKLQILKDTYKYAETREESLAALGEKVRLEMEEEIATKRQSLDEKRAQLEERRRTIKEKKELQHEEEMLKRQEARLEASENRLKSLQQSVGEAISKGISAVNSGVERYFDSFAQYYTDIQTRLLGTGKGYDDVKSLIDATIGISGIVKQTDVLEKIVDFLEAGVTRDVELRAVLDTLSDKIAATFDALDPTLLSLGRILQQDTTLARLGMESNLTQYLNAEYQDTSYLTSNANTETQAALLNALSTMPADIGAEVEYAVQKWLGSYTAVGVSSDTVSSIAQGIGYIGAGDIQSLTSNTQLMNLLISAANRGGVDLSSLLTSGLTVNDVNSLMRGIYSLATDIADSGNNVTKTAYATLFGMSLSDLAGFTNLSQDQITKIQKQQMSYSQMEQQSLNEIAQAASRVATSTLLSNIYENVMAIVGDSIASSPVGYTTYKIADLISSSGGIPLPAWLTMGTGFSNLPNVDDLIKSGIAGVSLLANIGTIIGGLSNGMQIDMDALLQSRNVESTASSSYISGFTSASTGNTGATYIGDTSESSIYGSSMMQIKDIVAQTGQEQEVDEESKSATTGDINRLIATIEKGVRVIMVNGSGNISNLGSWGVTFG